MPDQHTAARRTWRTYRRDRKEYWRLRCELSQKLPFPPDGESFMIHKFLERLSAQQHRRIRAVGVDVRDGVWRALQEALGVKGEILPYAVLVHIRYRDGDEWVDEWWIIYDKQTRRVQQWLVILHEVIHWLLGHDCVELVGERLFPDIHQTFVQAVMARTTYSKWEELIAEWLGRWILGIALGEPAERQPAGWRRWRQWLRWSVMLAAARRWAEWYPQYRRVRPLWKTLVQAKAVAALDPPGSRVVELLTADGLARRTRRMTLEIFDAQRNLRRWMDARIGERASQLARDAGLADSQIVPVADATVTAAAIKRREIQRRRGDPAATAEPVHLACAADADVYAELWRIQAVAAVSTSRIVKAAMADPVVQALLAEPADLALSRA